jgi:hypothetical protein
VRVPRRGLQRGTESAIDDVARAERQSDARKIREDGAIMSGVPRLGACDRVNQGGGATPQPNDVANCAWTVRRMRSIFAAWVRAAAIWPFAKSVSAAMEA